MGGTGLVTAAIALTAASGASAQHTAPPGANHPSPGPVIAYPPIPDAPVQPVAGQRWGGTLGGRWWGGVHAPGGWAAYHAPQRGYLLPTYWAAPRFRIFDWNAFGLPQPPVGYVWTRYYDDAVLIDARGAVRDSVRGVDWDVLDRGYPFDDRLRRDRDRIAAAPPAHALGSSGDTRRSAPYEEEYSSGDTRRAPPPYPRYREPPPPRPHLHGDDRWADDAEPDHLPPPSPRDGRGWRSGDGRTIVTVTTSTDGGPVYAPPPVVTYGGPGVTTVTVQVAPVVTTTTTEIIEEYATHARAPVRRPIRVTAKRLRRAR